MLTINWMIDALARAGVSRSGATNWTGLVKRIIGDAELDVDCHSDGGRCRTI
jgi:hypothetical protein